MPLGHYANGMIALTNVLALLLLWSRGKSVLDLWLMVVVCALTMETGLMALFSYSSLQRWLLCESFDSLHRFKSRVDRAAL